MAVAVDNELEKQRLRRNVEVSGGRQDNDAAEVSKWERVWVTTVAGRRFLKNDSIRMQNNTKAARKDEAIGVGEVVHKEAWEAPPGAAPQATSEFDRPLMIRS